MSCPPTLAPLADFGQMTKGRFIFHPAILIPLSFYPLTVYSKAQFRPEMSCPPTLAPLADFGQMTKGRFIFHPAILIPLSFYPINRCLPQCSAGFSTILLSRTIRIIRQNDPPQNQAGFFPFPKAVTGIRYCHPFKLALSGTGKKPAASAGFFIPFSRFIRFLIPV